MKSCLWIALLVTLVIGTKTQDLDLSDAFDFDDPSDPITTIPKQPKEPAKDPSPEPEKPAGIPPKEGGTDPKPVDPKKTAEDGMGFDLSDALGPDPVPGKPAVVPPKDGGTGGGSFGDNDLFDLSDNDNYKPDPGKGGGARAADPAPSDPNGGGGAPADQPQGEEAGSGQIAGIVSGIGVALLGAASSYFAYQKKKLCFKVQGGEDPESGKNAHGAQSDPQVMSNLLRSS
ncbi:CD99 antigen-like protein 2 isoform X6 [Oncorhynchus keta]|uniref:CD99 antigen-like protein 2 isoform X6 n=1 Tax=Oncorhynchus keta TaxID=8018 RepID=UPI00227A93F7|nr:CD99 antigen-like protein 2 isoform X6 [Oncorhynchus keta]